MEVYWKLLQNCKSDNFSFRKLIYTTDLISAVVWMHLTTRCQSLWQQVRVAMVTAAQLKVVGFYQVVDSSWKRGNLRKK